MDDIFDFYKTHTLEGTSKQFGISLYKLRKLFKKNGIAMHSRGDSIAIGMVEKYGVPNASNVPSFHKKQVDSIVRNKESSSAKMHGTIFYTNGYSNIRIKDGDTPPSGFVRGVTRRSLTEEETAKKNARLEKTMRDRYGVSHYMELPEMRKKIRDLSTPQEMARRYEVSKETRLARYGDANFNNREKTVQTCLERYGVDNASRIPGISQKIFLSKKRNNTVTTSKPEEELYALLCDKYSVNGVIRQYKCDRYPFRCDFYIPSEDLFIELNAHWSHGGMPFNPEDPRCVAKLSMWREKAKTSSSYRSALHVWCVRDVEKKRIAQENNLNYIVYYQ